MNFVISRALFKIAQPDGEAASSPACAIGAFTGRDGQTALKKLGFGLEPDLTINLN
jgi:hypothetical protein